MKPKTKKPSARALFQVRESAIQGKGAFALRAIPAETRIVEYIGEHITDEEADLRYDDSLMDRHHTFLFALDDGTCIDAAREGNDARYINHSCDPNCEAVNVEGRIFVESIKDIAPGEELVYDYQYVIGEGVRRTKKLLERYACRCGAEGCRGSILAPVKPAKKAKAKSATKKRARVGKSRKTAPKKRSVTAKGPARRKSAAKRKRA